jgi:hypothetical protein
VEDGQAAVEEHRSKAKSGLLLNAKQYKGGWLSIDDEGLKVW